ncbi:TPA: ABC transporter permease [archaeon]|uniref:ABC transporter permease n=1 Tax=Candidatus Naiadarchaeum limnaeum TaxID=2756139 RepID=A0A832V0J3_9ARCH|nr:ABC transporter permease [Candidatus Naiadarchaeum limnaeum]
MSELEGLYALWLREFKIFWREKPRLIGSLVTPILWLFLFGGGLGANVAIEEVNYQLFIFPGILAMMAIFNSIFFGVYIVWDRKIDFLKEVLVAPLSRATIFLGKVLGGCTDIFVQGSIILIIGFFIGVKISPIVFLLSMLFIILLAVGLVSIGLIIGSRLESLEGFQLIVSFLIFPLFFLSGALFPLNNLPAWLYSLTFLNPVTYGVDALRQITIGIGHFSIFLDFGVLLLFSGIMFLIGTYAFKTMKP